MRNAARSTDVTRKASIETARLKPHHPAANAKPGHHLGRRRDTHAGTVVYAIESATPVV
jgi:hypothetical protein